MCKLRTCGSCAKYFAWICRRCRPTHLFPTEIHAWLSENIKEGSTILEFGSGHGSIELAKRYDLISIEHDEQWIGISESKYIHAQITDNPISVENNQSGWYEITPIVEIIQAKQIAVFIIDGPPGDIGRHGILSIINKLPKEAVFIIDVIVGLAVHNFL